MENISLLKLGNTLPIITTVAIATTTIITMHLLHSIIITTTALAGLSLAASFTNPLRRRNGADPFVVYDGRYYYLTTTTGNDVQLTRAKTLGGLKSSEPKIVLKDSNSNRCCNVWAPGM